MNSDFSPFFLEFLIYSKFDLKVELASQAVGNIITFTGVPSGTVLPIIARKVDVTNSTATSLVALY